MNCKIEISARHVHLTEVDFRTLFGDEAVLENLIDLSQENEFAAKQTVTLKGPKKEINKVRIVGPLRDETQVEISRTDSFNLGINAPLKISGELPGDEIEVTGPNGSIKKNVAIVAKRHIHLSAKEAQSLSLNQDDIIKAKIEGERGLIFEQIVVRIDHDFSASIHLDTDEANAAGIDNNAIAELILE